jgi:hypothetical protein
MLGQFDSAVDISDIGRVEVRIAREGARRSDLRRLRVNFTVSGSPLCRGTYTLCIKHPRPTASASQSGLEPGTSCTAGEQSMQRAIRTALLITIWNLSLYYFRTKFNFMFLKNFKSFKMSSMYCTCTCMWHCISI